MRKTGLIREQLPSSGERLAAVLTLESNKNKRHPMFMGTQWGRGYNRESGKWDPGVT